jgi:poly-gamma-glutamate synthesis protein (capsule biosynthesis protein)
MENKTRKIIIFFILLMSFVLIGLFFFGKKSASYGSPSIALSSKKENAVSQKVVQSRESIKILFVGDMMFDRYIRQTGEKRGSDFVFAGVKNVLLANDLVVGNLEGPITDSASVSTNSIIGSRDNYIFTFPLDTGANLFKNNVKLVDIGNNHILNFGDEGLAKTKDNLKQNNVDFFGDSSGEKRIATFEKNGIKIIFVAYNQFENDAKNKTLNDIAKAKQLNADKIILYTHWGKEFVPESEDKIKALAHEFIDVGVDLIIGSHPHVIQNKEIYNGKTIYYSLGNFIFDQYFSSETQDGLIVQIEINPNDKKIVSSDFHVVMKNSGQTLQK